MLVEKHLMCAAFSCVLLPWVVLKCALLFAGYRVLSMGWCLLQLSRAIWKCTLQCTSLLLLWFCLYHILCGVLQCVCCKMIAVCLGILHLSLNNFSTIAECVCQFIVLTGGLCFFWENIVLSFCMNISFLVSFTCFPIVHFCSYLCVCVCANSSFSPLTGGWHCHRRYVSLCPFVRPAMHGRCINL